MSKIIEVKCKGVTVNIFNSHTGQYRYFQAPDYSSGKRKLWSFSNLDKAKTKALVHRSDLSHLRRGRQAD